jgi:transposase
VYIDEAGVDNTLNYVYGWSLKGTRCLAEKLGHFTERVSMIAAWCQGKVFAPMTFTGYCDSRVVETWFEQVLIPTLVPGQVVILDNASFHRKASLQKLLEPLGCRLLALPPYSPDLNFIEPLWNRIKALIKHHPDANRAFRDKVDDAFCSL